MVETLSFHSRGTGLIPGWGTKIPHVLLHGQKKKDGNYVWQLSGIIAIWTTLAMLLYLLSCPSSSMTRYMFFVFYNIDIFKEYSLHLYCFTVGIKNLRYNSIISYNSSLKVYNSVVFVIFIRLWNLLSHSGTFSSPSPKKYL